MQYENTMLRLKMLKQLLLFIALVLIVLLSACAKKQPKLTQDIKEQIHNNQPSIPFANTKEESNQWYKTHLSPIIKESKSKKGADEYEKFAKLYFADLSQIEYNTTSVQTDMLLQSVSFTMFSQEFLREFLFIMAQPLEIAPWSVFQSPLNFSDNIASANFVAQIARNLKQLENESYINLNDIILAQSLLHLTNKYSKQAHTSTKTQEITGLQEYKLPATMQSLLYYRIIYAKYFEKFQSNFILDNMTKNYPQSTLRIINQIFHTSQTTKTMQAQFRFPRFEPSNPVIILQCKAGSDNYPSIDSCISHIFIPWIFYLQRNLQKMKQYFLPIFIDSKLCVLVQHDKLIPYPYTQSRFCAATLQAWNSYKAR